MAASGSPLKRARATCHSVIDSPSAVSAYSASSGFLSRLIAGSDDRLAAHETVQRLGHQLLAGGRVTPFKGADPPAQNPNLIDPERQRRRRSCLHLRREQDQQARDRAAEVRAPHPRSAFPEQPGWGTDWWSARESKDAEVRGVELQVIGGPVLGPAKQQTVLDESLETVDDVYMRHV